MNSVYCLFFISLCYPSTAYIFLMIEVKPCPHYSEQKEETKPSQLWEVYKPIFLLQQYENKSQFCYMFLLFVLLPAWYGVWRHHQIVNTKKETRFTDSLRWYRRTRAPAMPGDTIFLY
jgi:hypothetical protein